MFLVFSLSWCSKHRVKNTSSKEVTKWLLRPSLHKRHNYITYISIVTVFSRSPSRRQWYHVVQRKNNHHVDLIDKLLFWDTMIQFWAGKKRLLSSHTPIIPSFYPTNSWLEAEPSPKMETWKLIHPNSIQGDQTTKEQISGMYFFCWGGSGEKYVEHHSGHIDLSNTKRVLPYSSVLFQISGKSINMIKHLPVAILVHGL